MQQRVIKLNVDCYVLCRRRQRRVLVYLALLVAMAQQQAMVVVVAAMLLVITATVTTTEVKVNHAHLTVVHLYRLAESQLVVSM
jgi:hypothetical protein